MKNEGVEAKKLNRSSKTNDQKDKSLPWWVELLFVQIGLPDKYLIKILKSKKNFNEFIKNEKKLIFIFFFVIISLAYFYPVVKLSKNKLHCESNAKKYLIENKNLIKVTRDSLRMLSTNFCNGGQEIYEIQSLD